MKNVSYILVALFISSCNLILLPSKQHVTIRTGNKDASIYIDNELRGKGDSLTLKLKKGKVRQVIIQAPNTSDSYHVLMGTRRSPGFLPLYALNVCNIIGLYLDPFLFKTISYKKINEMPCGNAFANRTAKEKYLNISSLKFDVKDKELDMPSYLFVYYKDSIENQYRHYEEKYKSKIIEKRLKLEKEGGSATIEHYTKDDDEDAYEIYKSLLKTGYIDTINQIFSDENNTLTIEGDIKSLIPYSVNKIFTNNPMVNNYGKVKVSIDWIIKNSYGEHLDTINTEGYSGEYAYNEKMKGNPSQSDAIVNSFSKLFQHQDFKKHNVFENSNKTPEITLNLKEPKFYVQEAKDALNASVTIKRKDGGHGSGFAISEDGYLLTNYHVIAGKTPSQLSEISVILSSGEEVKASVVRFNKMRDLALLKIENKFDKPFKLSKIKTFEKLLDVYALGTPKSIELGQTVSLGLISNERKVNNINMLQLSISINSGNSGGPLYDKNGVLHGVVTSKLVGYATEGVGFAIPSYLIQDYLNISFK